MPRWLQGWSLALLLMVGALGTAQADRRVALVVGNGAYQHVDRLPNPPLDARAVRDALAGLGFQVIYGEDLDKRRLERAIVDFAEASREADVALTYYAGHGSTFGDVSYLVPVDAEFTRLSAMSYELVSIENLLAELRQAKGIRIAIFDACRDNAKERELKRVATRGGEVTRGFVRPRNPEGLIVAYSTQYGLTAADGPAGTNSPFTTALLKNLPTPGLDVVSLFRKVGQQVLQDTRGNQRPAIEISLYDDYALVARKDEPAVPAVAVAPPAVAPPGPQADGAFLAFIAGLTDRQMLTQLGQNASPAVSEAAKQRLAALPAVAPVPEPVVKEPPPPPASVRPASAARGIVVPRLENVGVVNAVAFSPDGRHLASGGGDKTLKLWDVETGRVMRTFEGHAYAIYAVAFSPDGRRLVSGSLDKTLKLWDAETGRVMRTFEGHTDSVYAVAFSPDGRRLASSGPDNTLKLWNAETGRFVRTMDGKAAVAFSPDGRRLASGGPNNTLKLWDVETGRVIRTFKGHQNEIYAVAFSPDGRQIASASADTTLKLWDAYTGQPIHILEGHGNWVRSVAFSSDGRRLASASADNTLRLWDAETGRAVHTLKGHAYSVYSVAFSPDGRRLASASLDKALKIWNAETAALVQTMIGFQDGESVTLFPGGRFTASSGATKYLTVVEDGRSRPLDEAHRQAFQKE